MIPIDSLMEYAKRLHKPKKEDFMKTESIKEAVHSPAHYWKGGIETIDYIAAKLGPEGFKAYCLGNVLKYVSRWQDKNGEEDLRKAYVYLGWAIDGL